jgi:hypothetical protein
MPCRLCHQRIPFFRSWFTVAEFCCDDHEREYKDLMVTRLAASADVEPAAEAKPLFPYRNDPEPETVVEAETPAEDQTAPAPDEPLPDPAEVSEDDAEELWRLADEVGSLADEPQPAAVTETKSPSGGYNAKPAARKRRRAKRSRGGDGT